MTAQRQVPNRLAALPSRWRLFSQRPKRDEGIALVAVICLLALLAVFALSALDAARRHAQLARRSFESIQSQALADSAIRLAILELSSRASAALNGNAASRPFNVFDHEIVVSYDLEAGRIDLNSAGRDLLAAAFAANQLSENEANDWADRIVDWRDADDERAPHGAERAEYQRSGRTGGPRNGPFETVSELMQILGAQTLNVDLLDAFTVYSHSPDVRESLATPAAMRALRWADAKKLGGHRWLTGESALAQGVVTHRLAGEAVRLRACVGSSQVAQCRVAVLRFTGSTQQPVQVLAWQTDYGPAQDEPLPPASAAQVK